MEQPWVNGSAPFQSLRIQNCLDICGTFCHLQSKFIVILKLVFNVKKGGVFLYHFKFHRTFFHLFEKRLMVSDCDNRREDQINFMLFSPSLNHKKSLFVPAEKIWKSKFITRGIVKRIPFHHSMMSRRIKNHLSIYLLIFITCKPILTYFK